MREYLIDVAQRGTVHHHAFGAIDFAFGAGPVTPRSEQDEVALDQLVAAGLATATGPADLSAGKPTHDLEPPATGDPGVYPQRGSAGDVVAWVAGDHDRAAAALELEHTRGGRGPRSGVIRALEQILDPGA